MLQPSPPMAPAWDIAAVDGSGLIAMEEPRGRLVSTAGGDETDLEPADHVNQVPTNPASPQDELTICLPGLVEEAIRAAVDRLIHVIADQVTAESDDGESDAGDKNAASVLAVEVVPAAEAEEVVADDLGEQVQEEVSTQQQSMVATLNLSPRKVDAFCAPPLEDRRKLLDGPITRFRSKRNGGSPPRALSAQRHD